MKRILMLIMLVLTLLSLNPITSYAYSDSDSDLTVLLYQQEQEEADPVLSLATKAGIAIAIWVGVLVLLFIVGSILSVLTLASAKRSHPEPNYTISPMEQFTRSTYAVVIALTSLYFYISIPFLILIVLGLGGGALYLILQMRRIPVRAILLIGGFVLYTLYAIGRSLTIRIQHRDPGVVLTRAEAPDLWNTVDEVARKVGTRPADRIFLTPMPEIAVTERGGMIQKLRGAGERILILGLGVLPGMTQGQFKAILAHEYGHFSNRDTAGGSMGMVISASIHEMAYNLAVHGQGSWINPVWLFLNVFYRIYLRITLGASRLQEILADRYAALAYGAQNFIDGLTHVVRQSILWQVQASHELKLAFHEKRGPNNLYTLNLFGEEGVPKELDQEIERVMQRPTDVYDSHPGIQDRLALVKQLEGQGGSHHDPRPMLDLLPDAEEWQRKMSAHLFADVRASAR